MTAWAKVGAKVVCVDDKRSAISEGFPKWAPTEGEVYTIQEVYVRAEDGRVGLVLEEQLESDRFYNIRRFRPLITQEQNIAMFKSLLTDTPINETA